MLGRENLPGYCRRKVVGDVITARQGWRERKEVAGAEDLGQKGDCYRRAGEWRRAGGLTLGVSVVSMRDTAEPLLPCVSQI